MTTSETQSHTIGHRLARLRKERGISQFELQRMIPSVNIWRVENDQFSPSVGVLERIADALDATVELVPKK